MPYDSSTDDTLPATSSTASTTRDAASATFEGYAVGAMLGRGGMGEVVIATDLDIGRDVAIKHIRGELGTDAEARFLREAHIQARLDHPAIVPVYEIGRNAEGRPYFTMKRLVGRTLAEVLAADTQPLQRLLRVFSEVCRAIQFAHTRNIVHRDLKPANIMIGDFGEVYVLDWGVARVLNEGVDAALGPIPIRSGETEAGSLLGTPGYMAPEQVRGEPVDLSADIYSLGAILFEILTHEPLHSRTASLAATLETPTVAPSTRRPDVPLELDGLCCEALAADPARRPRARDVAERVQHYLDGDRDLERRRACAAEQVALARDALAIDDRGVAMQTAGRALALDPESKEAAQILASLVLQPPAKYPAELEAHLAEAELEISRRQWGQVGLGFLVFFVALPLILLAGIELHAAMVVFYALISIIVGLSFHWKHAGRPRAEVALVLGVVAMGALTRLFGPFILVPAILSILANGAISYPTLIRRPTITAAFLVVSYLVIVGLELAGVLDQTWRVTDHEIITRSAYLRLDNVAGTIVLIGSNAVVILIAAMFGLGVASARNDIRRKLAIQAWHLRKLVPPA